MHRFLPTLLRDRGRARDRRDARSRTASARYGGSKYGIGNRLWVGIVDLFGVRWMQARHFRVRLKE